MGILMNGEQSPVLIVPAAGQASRMGGEINKPYLLLEGKPVLAYTLEVFLKLNLFCLVCVPVAPGEESIFRKWVKVPFFPEQEGIFVVTGGRERQHSVYNGLKALKERGIPGEAIVCIHDGARPLVSEKIILEVYQASLDYGAAICGVPLKDTVKEIDAGGNVLKTPCRERFVLAQTPQCFRFSYLWEAHTSAEMDNFLASDDASLVERLGLTVKVVPGSYENIKLTTPSDLLLARAYLSRRPVKAARAEKGESFDEQFAPYPWPGCDHDLRGRSSK